jgi:hypothetical protein
MPYYRDCKYCGQKIIMAQGTYSWQPMEPDGSGRHDCGSGAVAGTQALASTVPAGPTWDFDTVLTRVTHFTRCWVCGDPVFFHRAENGGCVLFDNLEDRPWEVHHCWLEHMQERKNALAHFRIELWTSGFDGRFHRISRSRQRFRAGQDVTVEVNGYVADNHALYDNAVDLFLRSARGVLAGPLSYVDIANSENKVFRFYFPTVPARTLSDYELVTVRGCWQKIRGQWVLLASRIVRRNFGVDDIQEIHGIVNPEKRRCRYCGIAIPEDELWGLDADFHFECARCGQMRGTLTAEEFISRCRRIGKRKRPRRPNTG